MEISTKEREAIDEITKIFVKNQWCVTPEGIAAFARQYGEHIAVENVVVFMQETIKEAERR